MLTGLFPKSKFVVFLIITRLLLMYQNEIFHSSFCYFYIKYIVTALTLIIIIIIIIIII